MSKRRNHQLALRPKTSSIPRSKVVFTHSDPEPQYSVDPTTLGEFAIQWTADWFNGKFSVTDLPPEWVAFIQTSIHGGWCETSYDGAAPFSSVRWDALPWDDRVSAWIFSQVELEAAEMGGILGSIMDSMRDADVKTWGKSRRRLPFHRTLALPDDSTSTM
jgi:hypothetical protein